MVLWGSDDCPPSLLSASALIALFLVPGSVGSGYEKEAFKELTGGCGRRADCTGRGPRASESARGVEVTGGGSDRGVGISGGGGVGGGSTCSAGGDGRGGCFTHATVAAAHAAAAAAIAAAHAAVMEVGEPERSSSC